jgi:hypothetical protein
VADRIAHRTHWSATPLVIMSRVQGITGAFIGQSDLVGVTCNVYDRDTTEVIGATQPDVNVVVSNTLQTTSPWSADNIGYNIRYTVPAAMFPKGDKVYRVELVGTPNEGDSFLLAVVNVQTRRRLSA